MRYKVSFAKIATAGYKVKYTVVPLWDIKSVMKNKVKIRKYLQL